MSTLSQDNLPIKLKTPLGSNDLVAESVECTEAVNDDFQIVIHAASEKSDIKIDELLGKGITVTIRLDDGSDRVMHGLAETTEARGTTNIQASEGKPIYHYSLTLRPWLYFLRKTRSSVIYENMSVSDILQQVFSRNSKFASGDFDISSTSGQFEYIVQDQESDYDFAHRLMQLHGLNYSYKMSDGSHVLHVGRKNDGLPGGSFQAEFLPTEGDQERISYFSEQLTMMPGKTRTTDYNYKKPKSGMESAATGAGKKKNISSDLEVFDYPGTHEDSGGGKKLAEARRESLITEGYRYFAQGYVPKLTPGAKFKLTGHPVKEMNASYVVLRCTHSCENDLSNIDGKPTLTSRDYTGSYEFFTNEEDIAPARGPEVQTAMGLQIGIVTQAAENDPEDKGRVKVKFPHMEGNSTWCRVTQPWAGKEFGTLFFPLVGTEVLVGFMFNDPSRPVVIGGLYNFVDVPPPNRIKQLTSGVVTPAENHLLLKDVKGEELIDVNAKKDFNTNITENLTEKIGKDTKIETVENKEEKVGKDMVLDVGTNLTIKAGSKLTLQVGSTKVELDGQNVKVSSSNVKLDAKMDLKMSGLNASMEGKADAKVKSSATGSVEAGAILTLKGAMTKIN